MGTITMTEFNQQVSAVARRVVEEGETVRVTNRGRVVLRIVPEPQARGDVLESLISAGLASKPEREHRPIGPREPVALSRDLDELLAEVNADVDLA